MINKSIENRPLIIEDLRKMNCEELVKFLDHRFPHISEDSKFHFLKDEEINGNLFTFLKEDMVKSFNVKIAVKLAIMETLAEYKVINCIFKI